MRKKTSLYFVMPSFILIFLAYFIQTEFYFSPDVQYLLHATEQLISGGHYGSDIAETNPPMILYLYSPVHFITKYSKISLFVALRLYVLLLSTISLGLCYNLLKKIVRSTDILLFCFLFYTLLFALFFLPFISFGQREHILTILIMPYLLSAVLALKNQKIHPLLATSIGILAGLGFSLKPFFLAPLCLIESYFIFHRRQLFAWIRIETVIILAVFIFYLSTIFVFQPGYFNLILPLVLSYYFPVGRDSFIVMLACPSVIFCLALTANYFLIRKQDRYPELSTTLLLAMIGMTLAFVIPGMPWYYHVLPAFSLAWLLLANFSGQTLVIVKEKSRTHGEFIIDISFFMLFLSFILLIPITYCYNVIEFFYHGYQQLPTIAVSNYLNHYIYENNKLNISGTSQKISLTCFGLSTPDCFPLVSLVNGEYTNRFPAFWWYRGIRYAEKKQLSPDQKKQLLNDKKYLINSIAADLNKYKTQFIIIPKYHFDFIEGNAFNIIHYFSENYAFRCAFQGHYRYLTTIHSTQPTDIYVRK